MGPGLRRGDGVWRRYLLVGGMVVVAIIAIFARDAFAMISIWWNASTYQHCLFVLPLTAWLIWQRRAVLGSIDPAAWWPGLALLGGAVALWIVGAAAGVALVRHAALVFAVQASIVAMLGPRAARTIAFPLFYLVFLIPFGDEFVPPLQIVTARMATALLSLAQVPARLDGVFITTPNGWFEVAEACSGVKFLVAMVAYGALVANVCFRSWRRRAAFMALCVVAPVLANGIRAFATIYAAEWAGADAAGGFDHVVYGWFFFALVMAGVMAIGWRFFDRKIGAIDPVAMLPEHHRAPVAMVAAAAIVLAAGAPLWAATAGVAGRRALPNRVVPPIVAGWTPVLPEAGARWVARFDGADHRLYQRYRDAHGREVDLAIALYGWQDQGRKLGAFGQGAIDPASDWSWATSAVAPKGCGGARMLGPHGAARKAWTCMTVGGVVVGDPLALKKRTLAARLTGGDQRAGVLIISAREPDAAGAMRDFAQTLGAPEIVLARLFFAAAGA